MGAQRKTQNRKMVDFWPQRIPEKMMKRETKKMTSFLDFSFFFHVREHFPMKGRFILGD